MKCYLITAGPKPQQRQGSDSLDLTLQALGTQIKPVIDLVETYPVESRAAGYVTAINTLADMSGDTGEALAKIKLGIAVAMQRAGATKACVEAAARIVGVL